ncbi:MAG TPA: VWA domain-containing protein, partial [Thermoanaerobaculia bacterium]
QTLFTFKDASGLHYSDHTDCAAGEFKCSIADGGRDEDSNEPQGRRLDCNSGTLSLLVGNAAAPSFTSLDYLEIYRASPTFPDGDPNTDRTFVQERQLHHTKFILLDAATAARKLWTGSHNLTPVTPIGSRSEDVFTTEDPNICAAFLQEFERWWGGAAAIPNPANSFFGRFKTPAIAPSGTMPSILLPSGTFPWRVAFSPSNTPSLDMYQVCADHINAATKDILFLMEQFTDSGDLGPLHSTNFLMNNDLDPQVTSGLRLIGLMGNSDLTDSIYTRYAGDPDVAIAHSTSTHDKIALIDALRDTRQSHAGRMLCGSMNWSQGAFHINDEQTLLLGDPALANKALQRAMSGFVGAGLVPVEPADIVVVIDRSFSMTEVIPSGGTKMDATRTAADTFLDMLTADGTHRVALVRFGASVEPFAPPEALVPFTNSRRTTLHGRLMATNATLPIGGSTCYGLPLLEAQNLLTGIGSPHPRRIVVFLTDGEENTPPNADGIYQPLAATGAEIHTTAFGTFDPFNTTGANSILNDMATFSGGTFAQIDVDPVHLQKRFAEVARDAMGMVTVMDPTFEVSGRKAVRCKVPIDLFEGIVEFCAFWRAAQGSIIALVRTPWGDVLTPKQAGVTHLTGQGRDVWRVDIGRVARAAGERAAGIWVVELRAVDPRAAAIRTDVAVYASRGGGADLRVEIDRDKEGVFILARVLDGQRVAKANVEAVVFPPPTSRKRKPRTIRLKPVESKDPAWEGVLMARWPIEEEGVHSLRVVATGKTKKGEFRREAVTRWVQEPTPPRAPGRPAPEPLPKRDPTTGTIPKRKRSG